MHPVASEGVVAVSARPVILAVYHDYTRKAAVRYVGLAMVLRIVLDGFMQAVSDGPFSSRDSSSTGTGECFLSRRCTARSAIRDLQFRSYSCCESTRAENRGSLIGKILEYCCRKNNRLNAIIYLLFHLYVIIIWKSESSYEQFK